MNIKSLKKCLATLVIVREEMYSQLDTRMRIELDEVIAELEKASKAAVSGEVKLDQATVLSVLQVIGNLAVVTTNLKSLVNAFLGTN